MADDALRVALVVPDDTGHGVVRHAHGVARAIERLGGVELDVIEVPAGAGAADAARAALDDPRRRRPHLVHVHVTDRLYGDDVDAATATVTAMLRAMPCPTVVSLHDVPSPDDEPERYRSRSDLYRAVGALADGLIVCSEHERGLVEPLGHDATVVPLPVVTASRRPAPGRRCSEPATIGVLGFVYPGKGHDDVLAAMSLLAVVGVPCTLVCVGRTSDGHEDMADDLARRAAIAGVGFRLLGFVPDEELADELARIDVPIVPNRNPSASASLATWLGHGRCPLVRDGTYACEIDDRHPGVLTRYGADGPRSLADAIATALRDPASTWHDHPVGPTPTEVAELHVDAFRQALLVAAR